MPKRVGYLYAKMENKAFIRATILTAAKGRDDRNDIRPVIENLDYYVDKTYDMVVSGSFVPSRPREKLIYDSCSQKHRKIKVTSFWPDGVMHWLLTEVMRPVLMRGMCHWSCASIPGRGCKRVRQRIKRAMRNDPKGTKYAVEMDVAQYYPSVSIQRLMLALSRKIKDRRFLQTVRMVLESSGGGLGIGYYICQWLANFFLEPLDHFIMSLPGVKYITRHMDNIVLLGPNKKKLHRARQAIAEFMQNRLGLSMKGNWQVYPTKKRMVSAVGYRYAHTHVILRKRNFLRLTRQCRRVKKKLDAGKPVAFSQAAGLLSRIGQLKHCDSHGVRVKYVDPIGIKKLKEVVRYESKRRLAAKQRIFTGGAA